MKRILLCAIVSALALPCSAQDSEDFNFGELSFGMLQTDSDTISSKFLEYRALPEGAIAPFFHLKGKKGDFRYNFFGKNVRQTDQGYSVRIENQTVRLEGNYYDVPHNFGNAGKSLLTETSEGVFQMSDTLQESFQSTLIANQSQVGYPFLSNLVAPSLAAAKLVDVKLNRERADLKLRIAPEGKPVEVDFDYARERRTGTRAADGTAFGFGNVVETPEPLHYLTQDFGLHATYSGDWGIAQAAVNYNTFANRIASVTWDNPFRATDSTDGSAYTAPSSRTVNGAATGRMALPPDSEALSGSVAATFKFGSKTRLSANLGLGNWKQNETAFIPFTTNTAIEAPALPASKLDGKIDTTSIMAFFTSQPADHFHVNARYRRYDLNNKTPRLDFEGGYVRFDAVLEEIPRVSVPYGYTNDAFEASASYDFEQVTFEGGYKYASMKRTFRETGKTTENGFFVRADVRGNEWISLRAKYERSKRDYDHYDTAASEEASFLEPEGVSNQFILRRYDQAKRTVDRAGGSIQISPPSGKVTFMVSYLYNRDKYDDAPVLNEVTGQSEAPLGLQEAKYNNVTAEVDVTPTEKASLYAFYSHEKNDNLQAGRQSGASLSTSPLDGWTSAVVDKIDSLGGGASFTLVPDKWFLDLSGRWQKVNGNNDLFSPPGGSPDTAESIPLYDDTKITTISGKLRYELSKAWAFAVGGFYEEYTIQDSQTGGILNYMPGAFFLAANDGDYKAKVGYLLVTYRW